MSEGDDLAAEGGDRGSVMITRNSRGRSWRVTVKLGDQAAALREAYENARAIERLLDVEPDKAKATRA